MPTDDAMLVLRSIDESLKRLVVLAEGGGTRRITRKSNDPCVKCHMRTTCKSNCLDKDTYNFGKDH